MHWIVYYNDCLKDIIELFLFGKETVCLKRYYNVNGKIKSRMHQLNTNQSIHYAFCTIVMNFRSLIWVRTNKTSWSDWRRHRGKNYSLVAHRFTESFMPEGEEGDTQ